MHGFKPSSKNPELQGLISRLERHFPTAIQLLTLISKAPSNQRRSSQDAPSLSRGPTFPILDVCSTRGCFSALSKSSPGSRLAAVNGRHLTHLLCMFCLLREPLISILNLPRGEDERNP